MKNTKEDRKRFMRLYNIYYVCKTYLSNITTVSYEAVKSASSRTGYKVEGWFECRDALMELRKIKCLENLVLDLCGEMNFIAIDQPKPTLTVENYKRFASKKKNLECTMESIINMYESMGIGQTSCGIDVKIPKCDSLKEYMDYLKEIDFVFSQCPYLNSPEEEIRFNNVDVGSQWISFILVTAGTFGILNNLAKLIEKAIGIKSHLITLKQQEEMLNTMKLKNEVTDETIDVFKKMKRITLEGYVKELEDELGELRDGEERGKVEKSLEKLSTLLDKGVEIYSSIETPNEIKAPCEPCSGPTRSGSVCSISTPRRSATVARVP